MGKDINGVKLKGRVGKVDYKTNNVVNLSVATNSYYRDKSSNEQKVNTEWHCVKFFNPLSAKIKEFGIEKGSRVMIEAALKTSKWQKGGVEQKTLGIVAKDLEKLFSIKKEVQNVVVPAEAVGQQGQVASQVQGAGAYAAPMQVQAMQQVPSGGYKEY